MTSTTHRWRAVRLKFEPLKVLLGILLSCATPLLAQGRQDQNLNAQFQSAVAAYKTGRLEEAASGLEKLASRAPQSFDVQELLGLVYAAQKQNEKAVEHLQIAARLKPDSAAAHTNLAASLSRIGKLEPAGEELQKALDLEPGDFDANHNLGEFYVQRGKLAEACPYLERAQQIRPASYNNGYDLSLAYFLAGKLAEARTQVQALVSKSDTDELHNLLGQIEEKDGKFLVAAKEFQIAARMNPSEDNLFSWGSELLLHRTYDPAIEIFEQATARYPQSPRMFIGLGMALYARGKYDEAVKALVSAADLNPSDGRCYYFLYKAYDNSPSHADEVAQRFRRFSELQPKNGTALYYYAMSLWKGKRGEDPNIDMQKVESLLQKGVALDPRLVDAHVQLGNLYSTQHDYARSIPEYKRALELDANLPDAHYRLAQDYIHSGHRELAPKELEIYQKLRAQYLAESDKERAEVRQFVYAEQGNPAAAH
jgi:tetratricopeptide (TPR) repeat protein